MTEEVEVGGEVLGEKAITGLRRAGWALWVLLAASLSGLWFMDLGAWVSAGCMVWFLRPARMNLRVPYFVAGGLSLLHLLVTFAVRSLAKQSANSYSYEAGQAEPSVWAGLLLIATVVASAFLIWRMRSVFGKLFLWLFSLGLAFSLLPTAIYWQRYGTKNSPVLYWFLGLLVIIAAIGAYLLLVRRGLTQEQRSTMSLGSFLRMAASDFVRFPSPEGGSKIPQAVRGLSVSVLALLLLNQLSHISLGIDFLVGLLALAVLAYLVFGFFCLKAECKLPSCLGIEGGVMAALGVCVVFRSSSSASAVSFVALVYLPAFLLGAAFWLLRDYFPRGMRLAICALLVELIFFGLPVSYCLKDVIYVMVILPQLPAATIVILPVVRLGNCLRNKVRLGNCLSNKIDSGSSSGICGKMLLSNDVSHRSLIICWLGLTIFGLIFAFTDFVLAGIISRNESNVMRMYMGNGISALIVHGACYYILFALFSVWQRLKTVSGDAVVDKPCVELVFLRIVGYVLTAAIVLFWVFLCCTSVEFQEEYLIVVLAYMADVTKAYLNSALLVSEFNWINNQAYIHILILSYAFYAYVFAVVMGLLADISALAKRISPSKPTEST